MPALPQGRSRRGAPRRSRDQRGVSTIELALYMPLLMLAILLAVQFSLIYLGNQAASAAAREAARVARTTHSPAQGEQAGRNFAANIGTGVLEGRSVDVVQVGNRMRATVSGHAVELMTWLPAPRVEQVVEGPIEEFRAD